MGAQEQRCELCGAAMPPPTGKRGRPRDYCNEDTTGRPCAMLQRQIAHVTILADRVLDNTRGVGKGVWRTRALRIGQSIQAVGGDIAYREAPASAVDPRQAELWQTEKPPPGTAPEGGSPSATATPLTTVRGRVA